MPSYKSYCWSIGTTSFRMVEFNRKIEEQLKLLSAFWTEQPVETQWSCNNDIQKDYYEFIRSQGFIENKDAARKDKDAREKTSGLVDLGLIDTERRLTEVGQELLTIAEIGEFPRNNMLRIPADSFIYFKQLLKLSCEFDDGNVRPYIVLAYMIMELGELSKNEFTYLLPLATNRNRTILIINYIREIRKGNATIDDAIIAVLSEMDNYKLAKLMFTKAKLVDDLIIQEIGMNRKSRDYDKPYTELYTALSAFRYVCDSNCAPKDGIVRNLFKTVKRISGRAQIYWKKYLFNTSLTSVVERKGVSAVNKVKLFSTTSEEEFRNEFFNLLHLFKAKSLLDDYYDLNKRYFKTSDTILFEDNIVKFDIIPNCFFSLVKESLLDIAFTSADSLFSNTTLIDICGNFDIKQEQLFEKAEELYGVQVRSLYDIQNLVERERYDRLNQMIDEKFTDENIIKLLTYFENRDDNDILALVTNNADIPTIFEYIIGIAWYKLSDRKGKILDYLNLSLDADLLPISHAAGGNEDITYKYEKTNEYPAHTLLLEATLSNKTNQRRMEMEPVSRHLGEYLLNHKEKAYCLFATTFLHLNVISDFRGRKNNYYYSSDGSKFVDGMKIIPCNTSEIKTMIEKGITYAQLYKIFEEAYNSNVAPNLWYQKEIVNKLEV